MMLSIMKKMMNTFLENDGVDDDVSMMGIYLKKMAILMPIDYATDNDLDICCDDGDKDEDEKDHDSDDDDEDDHDDNSSGEVGVMEIGEGGADVNDAGD